MAAPTTDTESFPLPGYEDRLWEELAHLHAQSPQGTGYGPPPRRQRLRRRYLVAAGALSAAAGLVAVALVVGGNGPQTTTAPPAAAHPLPDDAVMVSETYHYGPGGVWTSTTWTDETTGARHTVGEPLSDAPEDHESTVTVETDHNGDETITVRGVDHGRREHWEHVASGGEVRLHPRWSHDFVDQGVAEGSFVPDGEELVDGVTRLRFVSPPPIWDNPNCPRLELGQPGFCNGSEYIPRTIWVDRVTRRPRKDVSMGSAGIVEETRYTYLPRRPENLALVEMTIPDGYERVPSPYDDDETVELGPGGGPPKPSR
jgi:hypothetical protein